MFARRRLHLVGFVLDRGSRGPSARGGCGGIATKGGSMRRKATAFFLMTWMLMLAPAAFAGEMYGTITEGGKAVGEGVAVEAQCGSNSYAVKTDKSGTFHLALKESGKCRLT